MPKQGPPDFPTSQINAARKPGSGGEYELYITQEPAYELATIKQGAAGSPTLAVDSGYAVAVSARPSDLVAVVTSNNFNATNLAGAPQFVLNVVFDDNSTGTVTAVLQMPAWLGQGTADRSFPIGFAVDAAHASKSVKAVTSLQSASNFPLNSKISIFAMPPIAMADYKRIGCQTNLQFTTKESPGRPVPCGLDGAAYVKRGRSEPGTVNFGGKGFTQADVIARYRGIQVILRADVKKDDVVVNERLFFIGVIYKKSAEVGEGDDDAAERCEGFYESFIATLPAATTMLALAMTSLGAFLTDHLGNPISAHLLG